LPYSGEFGTSSISKAFPDEQELSGRSVQRLRSTEERCVMKKTLTAVAAIATLALGTLAVPQQAEARHGRNAAIFGGIAAGALFGAAAANGAFGYYGPGYGYYGPGYGYYAPGPVYYGPRCYWTSRRYWNGYRWHSRRVRVCD
jgi:hypothetical protein